MNGVADELADLPGLTERLLALHVPAAHGRCRACTKPGTGIPSAVWPCVLHFYAAAAVEIRKQRDRGRGSSR